MSHISTETIGRRNFTSVHGRTINYKSNIQKCSWENTKCTFIRCFLVAIRSVCVSTGGFMLAIALKIARKTKNHSIVSKKWSIRIKNKTIWYQQKHLYLQMTIGQFNENWSSSIPWRQTCIKSLTVINVCLYLNFLSFSTEVIFPHGISQNSIITEIIP